jgi:hypothetical protein
MSTERSEQEARRFVSDAYRELGDTSVPEHLNQAILRQAAAESQSGLATGFRSSAWMKPLAWTATIALSLAIVLELTETSTRPALDLQGSDIALPSSIPVPREAVQRKEAAADRVFTKIQPAQQADARERAESIAIPMSKKAAAASIGCDAATRESRDDWMRCIQDLRDAGDTALADREQEAFILKFPPE